MNPLNHVAIIMDGNGRWAEQRKKPRNFGHRKGLDNIKPIVNFCKKKKNSLSNSVCVFFRQLEKI